MIPSIWQAEFTSAAQWQDAEPRLAVLHQLMDSIDDRVLISRHPFVINAWCAACQAVRPMTVTWLHPGGTSGGSVNPPWTETAHCHGCTLFSRVRALLALALQDNALRAGQVYLGEQVTTTFQVFSLIFPNLTGSEFLGQGIPSGEHRFWPEKNMAVRHEDMTSLSFPAASLDAVITLDVFEHIPNYRAAFRECRRVLRPGGHLLFTIPFYPAQPQTIVRARIGADGEITHDLPAEYHGDPLQGNNGSLCFQYFGWDILDDLRQAGFATAAAHKYWGPWQGHLGPTGYVFRARA